MDDALVRKAKAKQPKQTKTPDIVAVTPGELLCTPNRYHALQKPEQHVAIVEVLAGNENFTGEKLEHIRSAIIDAGYKEVVFLVMPTYEMYCEYAQRIQEKAMQSVLFTLEQREQLENEKDKKEKFVHAQLQQWMQDHQSKLIDYLKMCGIRATVLLCFDARENQKPTENLYIKKTATAKTYKLKNYYKGLIPAQAEFHDQSWELHEPCVLEESRMYFSRKVQSVVGAVANVVSSTSKPCCYLVLSEDVQVTANFLMAIQSVLSQEDKKSQMKFGVIGFDLKKPSRKKDKLYAEYESLQNEKREFVIEQQKAYESLQREKAQLQGDIKKFNERLQLETEQAQREQRLRLEAQVDRLYKQRNHLVEMFEGLCQVIRSFPALDHSTLLGLTSKIQRVITQQNEANNKDEQDEFASFLGAKHYLRLFAALMTVILRPECPSQIRNEMMAERAATLEKILCYQLQDDRFSLDEIFDLNKFKVLHAAVTTKSSHPNALVALSEKLKELRAYSEAEMLSEFKVEIIVRYISQLEELFQELAKTFPPAFNAERTDAQRAGNVGLLRKSVDTLNEVASTFDQKNETKASAEDLHF